MDSRHKVGTKPRNQVAVPMVLPSTHHQGAGERNAGQRVLDGGMTPGMVHEAYGAVQPGRLSGQNIRLRGVLRTAAK